MHAEICSDDLAAALMLAVAGAASAQPMPQNNPAAAANVKPERAIYAGAAQQPVVPRQAHAGGMRADHRPAAARQCIASFNGDSAPQH